MKIKETDPVAEEYKKIMTTALIHLKIIEDYFFRFPDKIPNPATPTLL